MLPLGPHTNLHPHAVLMPWSDAASSIKTSQNVQRPRGLLRALPIQLCGRASISRAPVTTRPPGRAEHNGVVTGPDSGRSTAITPPVIC